MGRSLKTYSLSSSTINMPWTMNYMLLRHLNKMVEEGKNITLREIVQIMIK